MRYCFRGRDFENVARTLSESAGGLDHKVDAFLASISAA
jgi:hypothetical protein